MSASTFSPKDFGIERNDKRLPGTPDIVLPKYRTVIFVNGCFWHGHEGCKYFVWMKNDAEFWKKKIEDNISRDQNKIEQLRERDWKVIVVWECEIKKPFKNNGLLLLVKGINQ